MIYKVNINEANLDEYQIFDVRSPSEWKESGVLKEAKLLYLYDNNGFLNENFIAELEKMLEKDKKIAFVCKSGVRSLNAALMLEDTLNLDSTNLEGGMSAYKRELK